MKFWDFQKATLRAVAAERKKLQSKQPANVLGEDSDSVRRSPPETAHPIQAQRPESQERRSSWVEDIIHFITGSPENENDSAQQSEVSDNSAHAALSAAQPLRRRAGYFPQHSKKNQKD